jgi:two-component system response regulator MprA
MQSGNRFLTVLLVEPDPLVRDVLGLALRGLAPEVVVMEACDGLEALAQVSALTPQAALVNLLLPRLSGLDTIRQLHARFGAGVPVVAMSALGLREIVQQAVAAGASDFIVRPCDPARVVEKVRAALARAEAVSYPCLRPQTTTGCPVTPSPRLGAAQL